MNFSKIDPAVLRAASRVEFLVLDCDGVLTDGRLYFSEEGESMKAFHVHDGQGIKAWQNAGFRTAVITARRSPIARVRSEELGIEFVIDGVADKAAALDDLMGTTQFVAEQVAYVGDDISDLGPMKRVGFPVAVGNCTEPLKEVALYMTSKAGGLGAVREVTDLLLHTRESDGS
ncbi:MAG TPA: HAD hydrolase family protein [Aridibacter sp.]|nr:HAD hydrolase family protein [Aridibacter sp.]